MQLITLLGLASLATAWPATLYSGGQCDGEEIGTIEVSEDPESCNNPEKLGGSMRVEGVTPDDGEWYIYNEGDCNGSARSAVWHPGNCLGFSGDGAASFFRCPGVCY